MKHPGQFRKEYTINCDLTDEEIHNRLDYLNSETKRQGGFSIMPLESWAFIRESDHFTVAYTVKGKRNIKVKGKGIVRRISNSRVEIVITYITSGFGTFVVFLFYVISICFWLGVIFVFIYEYYKSSTLTFQLAVIPVITTVAFLLLRSTTSAEIIDLHDKVTKAIKQEL